MTISAMTVKTYLSSQLNFGNSNSRIGGAKVTVKYESRGPILWCWGPDACAILGVWDDWMEHFIRWVTWVPSPCPKILSNLYSSIYTKK